ncbi:NYN domain-containing protein [Persephonella atlantica]|uniref:NYN domain-containing protein n=1 Tax=Persephonella atlantica TaxID=2699429 RepID=A0ABS1GFF9_9AQUI|nr:NYN domain-containing protein [Persephonella atlantica]MBK3331633.1 NYN domain-containing protein [Persephonella atlantica]
MHTSGKSRQLFKNQRVAVFVDIQNLYYSARDAFNRKVDFEKVLYTVLDGRVLVRAIAYLVKLHGVDQKGFINTLRHIGYQVREKEPKVFKRLDENGNLWTTVKADWDMGIAMDAISLAEKIDVAILASGDGDFVELVRYLHTKGVKVEIAAFKQTAAKELIEIADEFIDLTSFGEEIFL